MDAHLGLVLHVQVGDGSCYGEFDNPANQASSTWWISLTGQLEQYVDADMAAWTEAAGNFTWDSVETEGTPDQPLTTAQVQTLARLYVWGHQQYGWPLILSESPPAPGLGWHGMGGLAWGGHFGCPGDLRQAQRAEALYLASLVLSPPPIVPPITGDGMFGDLAASKQDDFNATVRFLWNLYRTDPMVPGDVSILWLAYQEPVTSKGFGGSFDAVIASIVDGASVAGKLRPSFVGAV
jgi:hypothetical protein